MSARTPLRGKEAKAILTDLMSRLQLGEDVFGSKPYVEKVQLRDGELILVDGKPVILRKRGQLVPTLRFDSAVKRLARLVVDMGAVPHICNGADIMVKGVRSVDREFVKGALVVIVDETYGKHLAIGEALVDSTSIRGMERGKVVSNLHFVGDDAWNAMKAIG